MSALVVQLQTQALTDLQTKAAEIGKEADVSLVGARAVGNLVRAHLFNLDARSPHSHFYSQAAKSVADPQIEGRGAVFTIKKVGLAQRWLGGDIKAGKGISSATGSLTKYLAIPARDEARDKTPAEFDDLMFVPRGNGRAMLVQALQTSIVGKSGKVLKKPGKRAAENERGGLVLFWLVPSVHQNPDPTVMPAQEKMEMTAAQAMENRLAKLLQSN